MTALMRATMGIREDKIVPEVGLGLISMAFSQITGLGKVPVHVVVVAVLFSEEALAIIKNRQLEKEIVFKADCIYERDLEAYCKYNGIGRANKTWSLARFLNGPIEIPASMYLTEQASYGILSTIGGDDVRPDQSGIY